MFFFFGLKLKHVTGFSATWYGRTTVLACDLFLLDTTIDSSPEIMNWVRGDDEHSKRGRRL
jgi:hypothetical protein